MLKLSKFIYQKARASRNKEVQAQPMAKATCQHQEAQVEGLLDSSSSSQAPGKCQICQSQKRASRIYRWKLIAGLILPDLLSSLDLTIVATATPFISSHFSNPPSHQTN